jgi:hypothetical protein
MLRKDQPAMIKLEMVWQSSMDAIEPLVAGLHIQNEQINFPVNFLGKTIKNAVFSGGYTGAI